MTNSISNVIKGLTLAVMVAVVPASFAGDSVLAKRSDIAQQGATGAAASAAGIIGTGRSAVGIIGTGRSTNGIIGTGRSADGIIGTGRSAVGIIGTGHAGL